MIGAATNRVINPRARQTPHTNSTTPTTYAQNSAFSKSDAFKKFRGVGSFSEQNWKPMDRERTPGNHSDQRLGDRCERAVDTTKCRH